MIKQHLYNFIVHNGERFLMKHFPYQFGTVPRSINDRYIEYHFILSNMFVPPSAVLDVGSSGAMLLVILNAIGYDIRGIDIRPYPINIPCFEIMDIKKTRFESHIFEIITCVSTMEHIDNDFEAIDEIKRLLMGHGILLMTVPFSDKYKETPFHRIYDKKRLDSLLEEFEYDIHITNSPEDTYKLALIKAKVR